MPNKATVENNESTLSKSWFYGDTTICTPNDYEKLKETFKTPVIAEFRGEKAEISLIDNDNLSINFVENNDEDEANYSIEINHLNVKSYGNSFDIFIDEGDGECNVDDIVLIY